MTATQEEKPFTRINKDFLRTVYEHTLVECDIEDL